MNQGYQPPRQEQTNRTHRVNNRQRTIQSPAANVYESNNKHTPQSQDQNNQQYYNRPISRNQYQVQQNGSVSKKSIKPYIVVIASIILIGIVILILSLTGIIAIGKESADNAINDDQPKRVTLDEFVLAAQSVAEEWEYGEQNFIQGKYVSSSDGEDFYDAYPSVGVTIAYYCESDSGKVNNILVAIDKDRFDTEKENLYITSFIGAWDQEMDKEDAVKISSSLLLQTIGSSILGKDTFYSETVRGRVYATFIYEDWDKYMFVLDFE